MVHVGPGSEEISTRAAFFCREFEATGADFEGNIRGLPRKVPRASGSFLWNLGLAAVFHKSGFYLPPSQRVSRLLGPYNDQSCLWQCNSSVCSFPCNN